MDEIENIAEIVRITVIIVFYSLILILKITLMIYVKKKHHYEYGFHKASFFIMFLAILLNLSSVLIY